MTFVAGVNAIAAVAARERRDAAAIVVLAVGACDWVVPPLPGAAPADEQTLGGRVDKRKLGLPAAQGAAGLAPVAQLEPRQQGFGAPRQKRAHRQQQHLIEELALVRP